MKLLNECYRHGLNEPDSFTLHELDYYEGSFVAFQIYMKAPCDCVVNTGKQFAYTPKSFNNLWVVCDAQLSFVEAVMTEKGMMYDRLEDNSQKVYRQGEDIILWAYRTSFKDFIEVSIYMQACGMKANMIEQQKIIVNNCGKINLRKQYLDLWMHPTTLARYYNVEPYSDRHFAILKRYLETLIPVGVRTITVIASDAPWHGQSKLFHDNHIANIFENNMVTVHRDPLCFDFSNLWRYIQLCMHVGLGPTIEVFGLAGVWNKQIQVYSNLNYLNEDEIEEYMHALYDFFVEKQCVDNVIVTIDEPENKELLYEEIAELKRKYPRYRVQCAIDKSDFIKDGRGAIDRLVTSFFTACQCSAEFDGWYICCGPDEPNTFISSDLIDIRYLAYLTKYFHAEKLLRWAYVAFPEKPNEDGRFLDFRAGDSYLIYPGNDGYPRLSLRYYQLIRFYEEMNLLAQDTALYKQVFCFKDIREILQDQYGVKEHAYIKDYEFYRKLRRKLVRLQKGS